MKNKYYLLNLFIMMQLGLVNAQVINIPADYPTIQQGINASVNGDTVLVQPGVYEENLLIDGKSIVLASTYIMTQDSSAIFNTIIDGQWWDEAVRIENYADENTQLTGFSIRNGVRGVLVLNSNPTISHCRIYNNIISGDTQGGGINISGFGSPNATYNTAKVIDCEIFNNESRHGAGICVDYNQGFIENCKIYNNKSWENGSQIMFWFTTTTVRNCVISMNVYLNRIIEFRGGSRPLLENNIFKSSANSTVLLSWEAASPILINNTFINLSGQQGNLAEINPPAHITMFNTLADGYVMADSMGYTSAYSRFDNLVDGPGNIYAEPRLNVDYTLSDCSPCIGTGTASYMFEDSLYYAPLIDFLYNSRPLPAGSSPDMGAAENTLGIPKLPPVITINPLAQEICEGGSVTLLVEATGSPEIYYQWQKNSSDIPGATSASFTINAIQESDEGNYRCLITNMCETVFSNTAVITVLQSPQIQVQPQDLIVYSGTDVQFALDASGDEPLTYQWYGPAGVIQSGTTSILVIQDVTSSDAGNYYCSITNSCGTISSNNVTLTIYEPLTINAGADFSTLLGDSVVLNGYYSGGSPSLSIQWTPEAQLYNSNTIQPQTRALFESTTFTLTVADMLTGYQAMDDVVVTVINTDTLAYFDQIGDTIYTYTKTGNCGYISGNNCDGDKIKANYFSDENIKYSCDKVLLRFGYAVKSSTEEIPVKIGVWAKSTDSDKPGDLIASAFLPLSQIVEDVLTNSTSVVTFNQAVELPKDFYIGVFLPETSGDTVVINTNKSGMRSSGSAWSLNADNQWISYASDPRFFLMISNSIFPVVRQNNLGFDESFSVSRNLEMFPNPAKDFLAVKFTSKSTEGELHIYDLNGTELSTYQITGETLTIKTSHLKTGVYLIKAILGRELYTGKLVVMTH